MSHIAKLFANGRSQAVRLPSEFRFEGKEVFIRRDQRTGDVILSRKPSGWDGFLAALVSLDVHGDFLGEAERDQESPARDPFAGISE